MTAPVQAQATSVQPQANPSVTKAAAMINDPGLLCNLKEASKIVFRIFQISFIILFLPLLFFLWITYQGFHGPRGIITMLRSEKSKFSILKL